MYVGWRDLVHARGRFGLMTVVVLLVTVLVGLLSGLTRGLAEESTSAITGLRAERLVFSGDEPDFSSSRVPTDGTLPGEPIGVATTRASTAEETQPVTAMGVRPGSAVTPDAAGVASGVVVLTNPVAEGLGITVGDRLAVAGVELQVGAVRGDASYSHVPVVWLDLGDWQRVTGADGATVMATDVPGAPQGFVDVALADSLDAIGSYRSENGSLQLIRGFLFVISALVIGAFFTVWTVQRFRDVAVLKALGASTGWLLRDALGQAAIVLLAGVGCGAVAVVLAGELARDRVPFVLDIATIAPPLAVLVVLGLLGAGLAVHRITRVDPMTALGSTR